MDIYNPNRNEYKAGFLIMIAIFSNREELE